MLRKYNNSLSFSRTIRKFTTMDFLQKREGLNLLLIGSMVNGVILSRGEATLINFIYKEPITKKNVHILTKEERLAGLKYKPRIIRTKLKDYVRFKVTKKKERKLKAAERLRLQIEKQNNARLWMVRRPADKWWQDVELPKEEEEKLIRENKMLPRRIRSIKAAIERFTTIKKSTLRPLSPVQKNDSDYHPTHFTFNNLVGQNVHIGHRANLLDPRSLDIVTGRRNGLYILNLLRTVRGLKAGLHTLSVTVAYRGKILFSNIDRRVLISISNATKKFCMRYSIINKKLPGILTNFFLTRHHSISLARTSQLPMFSLALAQYDHHVAIEAGYLGLPSLAIFDSNSNPFSLASYAVAGNDESVMTQTFYLRLVFRALRFGHQMFLLKWLKNRARFLDRFFKAFYLRIYRLSQHKYKFDRLKKAFFFTTLNDYFVKPPHSELTDNDAGVVSNIEANVRIDLTTIRNSSWVRDFDMYNPDLKEGKLNKQNLGIFNILLNHFVRKKLFSFLFKNIETFELNPIFHYNLLNLSTNMSEIFFPKEFLDETALLPFQSLNNLRLDGFVGYEDKEEHKLWYKVVPMFLGLLKKDGFCFELSDKKFTKYHFIKSFCFNRFFLFNARMDRYGWDPRSSKLVKKMVYKFLNYMDFRKSFYNKKLAQYRALVVNKFVLKPAIYMYRRKRMEFLMGELEKQIAEQNDQE